MSFQISGGKGMYDSPISVISSVDAHVHFDKVVDNSFLGMSSAQSRIADSLDEQATIQLTEVKNKVTMQYTEAVRELVSCVNNTDEATVKSLLSKINEALRLFNFSEENFIRSIEHFSDIDTYLYDYYENRKREMDFNKEDFFAVDFIRLVLENNGYIPSHELKNETFRKMVKMAEPGLEPYLIDKYVEYTKKVKDVVSEMSLLQFSLKTGIDIRMNISPDSIFSEGEIRRNREGNFEEDYDESTNFKIFVVLDDKKQYKVNGRYKQKVYDMNCSMEKLFDKLVYEEPDNLSFEDFFEKYNLSYTLLGTKTTGIHFGDDEFTIIAKDLEVITEQSILDDYNDKIADTIPVQKSKKGDKKKIEN